MFLPEKLKQLREKKDISLDKLMVGLSRVGLDISSETLSNWERGEAAPRADQLVKIAEFFDVSITYFFDLKRSRTSVA